ncbi:MAG: type II toxin-antitoxin system HicB family antitoxin [Gammaproteobacteria bacterium]|nr:type II toxin-antitoxin system HicB family antitoxin [Gammaproteobacteria bacterium]
MQHFAYPVTLAADETNGGFVVTCRDLPEVITQGDMLEDAIEAAEGALEAAIEVCIEDGLDIPLLIKAKKGEHLACLSARCAMKAAVYTAANN